MRSKRFVLAMVSILTGIQAAGLARPAPGDVFREYLWTNTGGDGRIDILMGGGVWFRNSGKAEGAWTRHLIAEKAPNGSPFAAGDLAGADFNNNGQVGDLTGNGVLDIFRLASHDAKELEVLVNQRVPGAGNTPRERMSEENLDDPVDLMF